MEKERKQRVYSAEYFLNLKLGYTPEEAQALADSWNYQAPQDPQERLKHARCGVEWEAKMRLLNTDLADGRISQEEYQKRARGLNRGVGE